MFGYTWIKIINLLTACFCHFENDLPWPSLMPRAKQIGPHEVGRETLSLNLYHPQLLSNWHDAFFRKLG